MTDAIETILEYLGNDIFVNGGINLPLTHLGIELDMTTAIFGNVL